MEAATSPRKYRGVAAQLSKYPQTEQTPIDPLSTKTPLNDDKDDPNNYWKLINAEKDHEMEAERPTNNRKFVCFVAFVFGTLPGLAGLVALVLVPGAPPPP